MSESKIAPNTFQTPNILVDDLMRLMTGDEVKCYLVIVRKTFGWLKRTDRIAKSQIMAYTGLSEKAVDESMKSLVKFGIVNRLSENNPTKNYGIEWEIQINDSAFDLSNMMDRDTKRQENNIKRSARMKKQVGTTQTPTYHTDTPGGYLVDTPQKPLSITKEEEETNQEQQNQTKTVYTFYQNNFTLLTSFLRDEIGDMIDTYSAHWVLEALKDCVEYNHRNLKYAKAILEGWKAKGFRTDTRSQDKAKRKLQYSAPVAPARHI